MNEEAMRKHYETTPKETLINILISSREQVEKLQKKNKELKQEIEKLKEENKQLKKFLHALEISEEQWLEETLGSDSNDQ